MTVVQTRLSKDVEAALEHERVNLTLTDEAMDQAVNVLKLLAAELTNN